MLRLCDPCPSSGRSFCTSSFLSCIILHSQFVRDCEPLALVWSPYLISLHSIHPGDRNHYVVPCLVALLYSPHHINKYLRLSFFSSFFLHLRSTSPTHTSSNLSLNTMNSKSTLTMFLSVLALLGLVLAVPADLALRESRLDLFKSCVNKFAPCHSGTPQFNKTAW